MSLLELHIEIRHVAYSNRTKVLHLYRLFIAYVGKIVGLILVCDVAYELSTKWGIGGSLKPWIGSS
jgi:hypothetical protein